MRPPLGAERRLATRMSRSRWRLREARLAAPRIGRIVVVDEQIAGATATTRARLPAWAAPPVDHSSASRVLAELDVDPDGDWLIKTGLFLDGRLDPTDSSDRSGRILHRAGPGVAALRVRRLDLSGYLVAVPLVGQPSMAPALGPLAYLQQLRAGSVDEPVAAIHLRAGARPVAVLAETSPPVALLRWRR